MYHYNIVCHHSHAQEVLKVLRNSDSRIKAEKLEIDSKLRFQIHVETDVDRMKVERFFGKIVSTNTDEVPISGLREIDTDGCILT